MSDINLPLSNKQRDYLNCRRYQTRNNYQNGSPMTEVLIVNMEKIKSCDILKREGLQKKHLLS